MKTNHALKQILLTLPLLLILTACQTTSTAPEEQSVKPGVNTEYLKPDLEVAEWVNRFEREGRETYDHRFEIVDAARIKPGMEVADIGTGTGLFVPLLSRAVGPRGTVYAVDIAQDFVEHVEKKAEGAGLKNVKTVLCTERSVELPANSIDMAFICDVYHHFEYPQSTLASIHRALRANGEIFMIEFKREPGVTSEWSISHVRAGQEEFTREIEAAGFRKVEEINDLMKENYILRFRKI